MDSFWSFISEVKLKHGIQRKTRESARGKQKRNDTNSYKSKRTFNRIFTADHVLFTLKRLSHAFDVLICFAFESEKAIEYDLKTLNNHKLSNK